LRNEKGKTAASATIDLLAEKTLFIKGAIDPADFSE
jgi:hypothetical protein